MGQMIGYECPNCKYEFEQFDGCGFVSVLKTYTCSQCVALVNVLVGIQGRIFDDIDLILYHMENPQFKRKFNTCPKCRRKKTLTPWDYTSKNCPKCKMKMKSNGMMGNWD